ncbi:MAG: hypothetical protein J0M12_00565 [Deltaproteobacteria bacterium]|nr:hypothetical protein [Deltaproteobacteria bacterium]
MDASHALIIVQALADGVNPTTGECFPAESPYQQAQVVRALALAVKALQQSVEQEVRRRSLPGNVGKPWSVSDETTLAAEYDSGRNIQELAQHFDRTVGAIRARLVKLGKIEDEGSNYAPYRRNPPAHRFG